MKPTLLKSLLALFMTCLMTTTFAQAPDPGPNPDDIVDSLTTLPVTLTGLSAYRNPDQTVSVNWTSANEINIAAYTLEKSTTGNGFTGICNVPPSRNNGTTAVYTLPDTHAAGDYTYYRIKATGTNGRAQYTAIVKVALRQSSSSVTVFPNPVTNKSINVQFSNKAAGLYTVALCNSEGRVVYKNTCMVTNSTFSERFGIGENVSAGIYFLVVTSPDHTQEILKIVIL